MSLCRRKTAPMLRRQRGVAIVEFVICLPLLLLLMLAAAEFGRILFQYNTLTKAVRDGGRYLSTNAFFGNSAIPNDAARTDAENLVVCGKVACGAGDELLPGLTTDMVWTVVTPGVDHVTVGADYEYAPLVIPSLTITLTSTIVKRVI